MKNFNDYLRQKWKIPKRFKPTELELRLVEGIVPKNEPFREVALEACAYYGFQEDNYKTKIN